MITMNWTHIRNIILNNNYRIRLLGIEKSSIFSMSPQTTLFVKNCSKKNNLKKPLEWVLKGGERNKKFDIFFRILKPFHLIN